MQVRNSQILEILNLLSFFNDKVTPFSYSLIKFKKKLQELGLEYDNNKISLIHKFATKKEDGSLLLKDGKEFLENLNDLIFVSDNLKLSLLKELQELGNNINEVDFQINLDEVYYDSRISQLRSIENYINENVPFNIIEFLENNKILYESKNRSEDL